MILVTSVISVISFGIVFQMRMRETLKTFVTRAIFGKVEGSRPGSDSAVESMTMSPLGGQGQGYRIHIHSHSGRSGFKGLNLKPPIK